MIVTLERLRAFARENDSSLDELARYADTSRGEMERLVHAHGIPYRNRKRLYGFGSSLTDDEKAIFIEMYQAGSTIKAIMDRTGRSHKLILAYVRRCGITRSVPKGLGSSLGAAQQAIMMRMLETGATDAEISNAVGLGVESINRYRYRLGYKRNDAPTKQKAEPKLAPVSVSRREKKTGIDYWEKWQARVFGGTV